MSTAEFYIDKYRIKERDPTRKGSHFARSTKKFKRIKEDDDPAVIAAGQRATVAWAGLALDLCDMNKLLMSTKNLDTKFKLMDSIDIAKLKQATASRHPKFDVNRARFILDAARDIPVTVKFK